MALVIPVAAAAVGAAVGYILATKKPSLSSATSPGQILTLGYWKIRGLCAPLRMMMYYAGVPFISKSYGEDAKTEWFGKAKEDVKKRNSLANLPYIIDGDTVVTQSNSCLLYLGKRLGIDQPEHFLHNHQALDQVMDLRNDTMKIVYGFAGVTKEGFPAALAKHMGGGAATHLAKLEGFVVGPFVCGETPQSADFHLFEMLDQHLSMCAETEGVAPLELAKYPKLQAQHAAMRSHPKLQKYFGSDFHAKYAFNNAMYTHFKGSGFGDGPFGPTLEEKIEM